MGKLMRSINKEYVGKEVESVEELNEQMEQIDACAAVRKIQMISFDEDESDHLYIYRVNKSPDTIQARYGAEQIAERVFRLPTYRSVWPF